MGQCGVTSGDRASRIYRQLLDAILDGPLRPGERLPPTREVARRLDVARNTVLVAYERLTAEGLVVTRVGAWGCRRLGPCGRPGVGRTTAGRRARRRGWRRAVPRTGRRG
ncbi:winged helix-turn-helix transcriptional regulator [Micromonospora tulbaghiae]|uniref:Winged helix-turn-helix transcriptional regulator n=1 Tax=Micromonospora tulbaghiae TaxID=479978 RepID=A0AAW4JQ19_9ACTN|nr:winged helix-turn-helix transcriptional regulator [Micromonospora tulbaghiae]